MKITYFEDLKVGQEASMTKTVTEADIMAFCGVSGDFNRLHTDEEWVRERTPYRGRIAHGVLILALSTGIRTPVRDDLEVIAYLEETRRFVAPVYPGDTLRVHHRIDHVRQSSSRPGTGIVRIAVEVHNQRSEVVQSGTDVLLVASRLSIGGMA